MNSLLLMIEIISASKEKRVSARLQRFSIECSGNFAWRGLWSATAMVASDFAEEKHLLPVPVGQTKGLRARQPRVDNPLARQAA